MNTPPDRFTRRCGPHCRLVMCNAFAIDQHGDLMHIDNPNCRCHRCRPNRFVDAQ